MRVVIPHRCPEASESVAALLHDGQHRRQVELGAAQDQQIQVPKQAVMLMGQMLVG